MEILSSSAYNLLFAATIILFFSSYLRNLTRRRNSPPSPLSLPIIGHLHLLKKPIHRSLADLASRHGPILSLRFGYRPVLVVTSPSLADECFSKNDVIFANRPRLLAGKHLGYNYTTIPWASYGQHWRNIRRISTVEIFSSARLNSLTDAREEEVNAMIHGLARNCNKKFEFTKVQLKPVLFELVLNVMMRMIAGKRYYGMDVREAEEAKMIREIVEETFEVSSSTNLADFLPLFRLGEKRVVSLHQKRDAFMQSLVDRHRESNYKQIGGEEKMGKKKSVVEVLLELQQNDPEYYTDEIIKGAGVTMLTAGTDTSMVTIEWAMSLLLNHPDTMAKAQAELDRIVGQRRMVAESDLPNLPILHCIINEALRLHPPAPIIPAHESSADCTVGGFHVPSGTMLLVNAWAIQRDPAVWPDATSFKPERFVGGDERGGGRMMMPFGMGRRGCPGEGLAMRVMGLALGALVQCFEWARVGDEEVDMSEAAGLVVHKAEPLVTMCMPRGILKKELEIY